MGRKHDLLARASRLGRDGVRDAIALNLRGGVLGMGKKAIPAADCETCRYSALPSSGGHCYMFRERPGDQCGQYMVNADE